MIRLLPFVLIAFKVWMLVDAIRRREPYYWMMIIAFVPFGSVIYFFMVKVRDFDLESLANRLRRPPSVKQLRTDYERTPSQERLVALAEGLNREREYGEAVDRFRKVLSQDPDHPDALYGAGQACVHLERHAEAIEPLSRVIEIHAGYRDYAAWPYRAHALHESGQVERSLASLRELVASSPRLKHSIVLAHYLIETDQQSEAREVLEHAIEAHRASPRFIRRGNFRPMLEARRMLKTVS